LDLDEFFFVPPKGSNGFSMLYFESPNHKIKNAADAVRNQNTKEITPYSTAADQVTNRCDTNDSNPQNHP